MKKFHLVYTCVILPIIAVGLIVIFAESLQSKYSDPISSTITLLPAVLAAAIAIGLFLRKKWALYIHLALSGIISLFLISTILFTSSSNPDSSIILVIPAVIATIAFIYYTKNKDYFGHKCAPLQENIDPEAKYQKNFAYIRSETETEVTIVWNPVAQIVALVPLPCSFFFSCLAERIPLFWAFSALCMLFFFGYGTTHLAISWRVRKEIKEAKKSGCAQVSGGIFSFSNPSTVTIRPHSGGLDNKNQPEPVATSSSHDHELPPSEHSEYTPSPSKPLETEKVTPKLICYAAF